MKEPNSWKTQRRKLSAEVRTCIAKGNPMRVNLSVPKHIITSPVLRDFAYNQDFQGKVLPIVFMDGSRPPDFKLGNLKKKEGNKGEKPTLNLGLMSFRHPDMDFLVDYYIVRNREISIVKGMADEEEVAFRRTQEALVGLENIEIRVFHTGLEPMVVGFYRAVAEKMIQEQGVVIQPYYFMPERGTNHKPPYTPSSPGALIENYIPGEPWN